MGKEPARKTSYRGTSREQYNRTGGGRTEQGYSNAMKKSILGTEGSIRMNKDESMHVFDATGKKLTTVQGKGARVSFDSRTIPTDAIITHNHPRALGRTGIMSFGNSFSRADVTSAAVLNAREMRAVTPRYTFSIKRPKNGWGDPVKIDKAYRKIERDLIKENNRYINKASNRDRAYTRMTRSEATHYHDIITRLAKQMGWDYTKKRG